MQAGDALLLRRCLTDGDASGLQEIHLAGPVRLRALRVDPPPFHQGDGDGGGDGVTGAAAAAAAAAAVSLTVFARDLESPLASRFACVGAGLGLPPAGARAYELTPILTDHLVIQGRYQVDLTVSLFGVDLAAVAAGAGVKQPEEVGTATPPTIDVAAAAAVAAADRVAEDVVPAATVAAFTPVLDLWRAAGDAAAVGAGVVDELRAAAAGKGSTAADTGADEPPPPSPSANGHHHPVHAPSAMTDADADEAAAAALAWCRSLAATPRDAEPSPTAVAGVAAAALACRAPPLARRFVAGGGVGVLGDILYRGGGAGAAGSAVVADAIAALAAATAAVPGDGVAAAAASAGGEGSSPVDRVAMLLAAGPLDPAVVTAGLAVVGRVGVWTAARAFVAAAHAAAAAATGPSGGATRTVQTALAPATTAADRLAAALARTAPPPRPHAVAARVDPRAGIAAARPRTPDTAAVGVLGAAGVWPAAAAAARAPALHAARLEAGGKLPPGTSAGAVAGALVAPLARHLARLVALALGAPGGARAMLGEGAAVAALADALAGGEEGDQEAAGPATGLRASLAAATDAAALAGAGSSDTTAATPALARLLEATVTEAGRRAVVAALAADAAALDAALAAVSTPRAPRADGDPAGSTAWRADARYAAELVALVTRDPSPAVLAAWQRRAGRVRRAMARAAESCPAGAGGFRDPGLAAAAEAHARAAAVEAASTGGLARTLLGLASALPRLGVVPAAGAGRHPDPAAVRAFFLNAATAGAAHARLALVAAVLSQRGGARAAGEAADAGGLAVLEAAVRASTAGLVSSTADALWEDVGGDALDAVTVAALRARAAGLATVAARAAGALLRRLAALGAAGGGAALQDALLALHAAAVTSPEGLAAQRGARGSACAGAAPLLAARVAAARALACWIDRGGRAAPRPPWTPDLLAAALAGGRYSAARPALPLPEATALAPSQPLAVLALLGDLFPPEWPPPGAVRSAARPHPPPSRMADRAALARACVPVADGLTRLVTTASAAEPALVRAALVRAAARAAGLGGGMGVFLMGPLVDTLKTAAAGAAAAAPPGGAAAGGPPPTPAAVAAAHAAARRALEVVVPLAYRPALKAALLDLGVVDALARLLARLIPVAAAAGTTTAPPRSRASTVPATTPAAAGAMVTMALEATAALCNPAIALDPSASEDARGASDGPPGSQAAVLAAVLFASLPRLGANAHVAARVVALLAGTAPGRAALVSAAGRWWSQKEPEAGGAADPGAALAWAAGRLREEGAKADLAVAESVAAALEKVTGTSGVAAAAGDDDDDDDAVDPAPRRFAAAVAASLRAAPSSAGPASHDPADLCAGCCGANDDDDASSTDGGDPGDDPGGVAGFGLPSIHDAPTRMFWRNIAARQGDAPAPPRMGTGTVAYGLPADVTAAGAPAAGWPPGLTPQKRPREVGVADLRAAPVLDKLPPVL